MALRPGTDILFAACTTEINLNGLRIPPFAVGMGDVLSLDWPGLAGGKEQQEFLSALRQEREVPGLSVHTRIAVASPYGKGLEETLVSQIPELDMLLDVAAAAVRQRLLAEINSPLRNLPATPRAILAMHLACLESRFVACDSAGQDPLGVEALLDFADKKAGQGWGFIYFRLPSFPLRGRGTR